MSRDTRTGTSNRGRTDGAVRRLSLWKFWLIGAAVVLADIAGSVLLMHGGYEVTAMLWAALCALVMMVGVTEYAKVAIIGIVIACAAGIVASGDDAPVFGSTARDVPIAEAPGVQATFLHFRDGRVLADMAEAVDILGGTQRQGTHVLYTLYVAPVVGDGWSPDQPVTVFAVTGHPGRDQGRSQWAHPWRAGIRLGGLNAGRIHEGIARIAQHSGIVALGNAAVIRWTADPEAEAAAARRRLATITLVALLTWTLAIWGVRLIAACTARARRR